MNKINWEMIGALAGISSIILSFAIAWEQIEKRWPWIIISIFASVVLIIAINQRKKIKMFLKPKPHLVMCVKDINCTISVKRQPSNQGGGSKTVDRLFLNAEVAFEIKNQNPIKATNIFGTSLQLILGEDKKPFILSINTHEDRAKRYTLGRRETLPLLLGFPQNDITDVVQKFYPNVSYTLKYTFKSDDFPSAKTIKVSGIISKCDWRGDEEAIQVLRRTGYYH